jgi:hypothetical protein
MKIVKDVMISTAIESIWTYLISDNRLFATRKRRAEQGQARHGRNLRPHYEIMESTPPNSLTLKSLIPDLPIVTTLELSQKGRRTGLKVIITGWDKISHDRAKNEMPKIAMEWEKILSVIKKEMESMAV